MVLITINRALARILHFMASIVDVYRLDVYCKIINTDCAKSNAVLLIEHSMVIKRKAISTSLRSEHPALFAFKERLLSRQFM